MIFENILKNLPQNPSFRSFKLKDVNPLGGQKKNRIIYAPNESMKIIHYRLIEYLRNLNLAFPFSAGAKPGNSPRKNVMRHRKSRYFYLTDIHNAYLNVKGEKLAKILCDLDYSLGQFQQEMSDFLKHHCLNRSGGLIIGAPASPDLFNIYAGVLIDRPMAGLCARYGSCTNDLTLFDLTSFSRISKQKERKRAERQDDFVYSRYLDDLTFSSINEPIGKVKREKIREIIEKAGFSVNHRKSFVYDLKKNPISINGIGLRFGGKIFLPRHYLKRIRGFIHLSLTKKVTNFNKVNGMMGLFVDSVRNRRLNQTEKKLRVQYRMLYHKIFS